MKGLIITIPHGMILHRVQDDQCPSGDRTSGFHIRSEYADLYPDSDSTWITE